MHAYSHGDERGRALGLIAFLSVVLSIALNVVYEWLHVGPAWLLSAPTVAATFGILYGLLERFAWRWSLLRALGIVATPIVEGHYVGQLVSSYQQVTLPVRIEIEQTWTRLVVRFKVTEPASSESISLAASLGDIGRHQARLTYSYRNTIRPGVAERDMNDHDGTAELSIDAATGLASGRYYNYRGRQGTLALQRESR
jgi:hypothetical protein